MSKRKPTSKPQPPPRSKKQDLRKKPSLADQPPEEEKNALTPEELKGQLLYEMRQVGYKGDDFIESLQTSVVDKQKRGKPPRMVRFIHYRIWAFHLLKKEIGPEDAEFAFPATVLKFIRTIAPGDIKGEIREDAYKVTMEDFCYAMELPPNT